MRIGVILDGDFIHDQRVINEVGILEEAGNKIFILNLPAQNIQTLSYFSSNIHLFKVSFSKKLNNYLFALENLFPLYDLLWHREISNLIKKNDIEFLHVHDLYLAKAAGWAAQFFKIPLIIDLHENYPEAINNYLWATRFPARLIVRPDKWKQKERKYLSFADRIIVLSSNFREYLISKYQEIDPGKIFIYPNVPDIKMLLANKIDKQIFPLTDKKIVFYFGVISKRRGIYTAIEALEKILAAHPGIHMLLIGPIDKAEKNEFMKIFHRDVVKDHLTYYSWRNISEFPSFAKCSQICISPLIKNPQHESGVANKVFQYMLFGKPILVSDCTPQMEIIRETGCGLVFRNGDSTDMAAKLSELLSAPEACRIMGEKGRQAIISKYNTEFQGVTIIRAYAGLKEKNGSNT